MSIANGKPNHSLTLDVCRERTPAPAGVGAWAEKLKVAAFDAVVESDITDLMKSLMVKAKAGDIAAAKLVLGYLTGSQNSKPARRRKKPKETGRVIPTTAETVTAADMTNRQSRMLIALFLKVNRSATIATLARGLQMEQGKLLGYLDHTWFAEKQGAWSLTSLGNNAIE